MLIAWYMDHINYLTVTILMTMESTIIPIPSEIIVPAAAWKAANGQLNIVGVALCGTLGSVIGALINYSVSRTLGRTVLNALADTKIAHLLHISSQKLEKTEEFYLKYGRSSTFIGRLVPVVRHLISIPAGLSKMGVRSFVLFTFAGSLVWNTILSAMGFYLYTQKELIAHYEHLLKLGMFGLFGVFVVFVIFRSIQRAQKKA